mmetsp:Transcript_7997/g.19845  ORF Transcript_7997/g.19845 Transcript_7997/m.19845 type:complete len:423 (-) Transcript_7997:203-1471(-)
MPQRRVCSTVHQHITASSDLRKKRVETVGHIGERVGRLGGSISVEVIPETLQRITESEDNVSCGTLSDLAVLFHLGVVLLGGFLGHFKDQSGVLEHVTGVGLDGLGGESDASVDLIVVNDHTLDGHAWLKNLFQVFDAVVRNLRNVQETGHSTDLDKGSVRLEGLDDTVDQISAGKVGHLGFDNGLSVGDDQFVVFLVDLQEFEGKDLSDQVLGGHLSGQVGSGKEGTESLDQADGSSTVHTDNLGLEDGVFGLHLQDGFPGRSVLDSSDGNQELSVLVLVRDDLEVIVFVEVDQVIDGGSNGLDEGGFGFGQEGGGLGANVNNNTLGSVFDALSLNDGVSFKGIRSLGDGGGECIVVERDRFDVVVLDGLLESLVVLLQAIESGGLNDGSLGGGGIHSGRVQGRSGVGSRSGRESSSACRE